MKQRKMLVCDDEVMMRQGIKVFLPWDELGITTILLASDPYEAIELFREHQPDIVISDIRMPGMNGIELIRTLKEISDNSIFIIISGYDDFEIAQQGFSISAFDYLLKPINSEDLRSTIIRSIDTLNERERQVSELDSANILLEKSKQVLIHRLANEIIQGSFKNDKQLLEKRFSQLGINFSYNNYICAVGSVVSSSHDAMDKSACFDTIKQKIHEDFPFINDKACTDALTIYNDEHITVILGYNDCNSLDYIEQLVNDAFLNLGKLFGMTYVLVISRLSPSLQDMQSVHIDTKKACDYLQFTKQYGVYNSKQFSSNQYHPFLVPLEKRKELMKYVRQHDYPYIHEMLFGIKDGVLKLALQNKEYLSSNIIDMMFSAAKLLTERNCKIESVYTIEMYTHAFFNSFNNIDQLFAWLEHYFVTISDMYNNTSNTQGDSAVITRVKNYVHENYALTLSLIEIANMLYYNPNYLGRLFSKYEKQRFSDYLHDVRINKAIDLLKTTDYSYRLISEMVGYSDASYFFKMFKKLTNLTPKEYKYGAPMETTL